MMRSPETGSASEAGAIPAPDTVPPTRTSASSPPSWASAPNGWPRRFWSTGEVLLVFAVAALMRVPFLGHIPHKDELNHVLAARALLVRGTYEILPGAVPYERAWLFTSMVASAFRLLGESLVVGRLPAFLAGSLLVVALFVWVRNEAGRVGAWTAALAFAIMPISIHLSQWVRFYTLHALAVFAACILVYRIAQPPKLRVASKIGYGIAAAALLALAMHLQFTTIVALGGLSVWIVLMATPRLLARYPARRQRIWLASGVVAVLFAALFLLRWTGTLDTVTGLVTYTDLWAERNRDNVRFYHDFLLGQYPTLYTLFPLAILIAGAYRPRATLLALCVFSTAFVTHSLVAWKSERYIFYALPMFFAIWGFAIGGALPWLLDIGRILGARSPFARLSPTQLNTAIAAVLAGCLLFAAAGNTAVSHGRKALTEGDREWRWGGFRGQPDWVSAATLLEDQLLMADAVLASYDVTAIYAFARLDYVLRRVRGGSGDLPDFAPRGKSPLPVVTSRAGLDLVMACEPRGLIVIERSHWRNEAVIPRALADHIEASTIPLPLPDHLRLFAFWWESSGSIDDDRCAVLLSGSPGD
jgi:hypothetical protein